MLRGYSHEYVVGTIQNYLSTVTKVKLIFLLQLKLDTRWRQMCRRKKNNLLRLYESYFYEQVEPI